MKDKAITIGGNPYRLTPLTAFDVSAVLNDWKKNAPDPVKQLLETANQLPDGLKDEFIRKHLDGAFEAKKQTGTLNDPAFRSYLETPEGASKLVSRMLQANHPHLTPVQAFEITAEGLAEHGDDFFRGLVP